MTQRVFFEGHPRVHAVEEKHSFFISSFWHRGSVKSAQGLESFLITHSSLGDVKLEIGIPVVAPRGRAMGGVNK